MLCSDSGEATGEKGYYRNNLVAEKRSLMGDHAVCRTFYVLYDKAEFLGREDLGLNFVTYWKKSKPNARTKWIQSMEKVLSILFTLLSTSRPYSVLCQSKQEGGNRNQMLLLSKTPTAPVRFHWFDYSLTQERALCASHSAQVLLKRCHRMHCFQVEHCHVRENCCYFSYSKLITSHRTFKFTVLYLSYS